MSHRHSIWLSRIIAEEAAAHGVPYTKVTFAESLRAHWRLLVALSRKPSDHDPDCAGTAKPNAVVCSS